MNEVNQVIAVMEQFDCDDERANRYLDLRDEGYSRNAALVMSGLKDPSYPADLNVDTDTPTWRRTA